MEGGGHAAWLVSPSGFARRTATGALLLGLAAASACSLITGPDLRVTIEELSSSIVIRPQFAEISGEGGDVVVEGVTEKAAPCHRLVAEGDRRETREGYGVELVVGDEFSESNCGTEGVDTSAFSEYRARIGGLEPGTYAVEVTHSFQTGRPDTLIARATVTVQ